MFCPQSISIPASNSDWNHISDKARVVHSVSTDHGRAFDASSVRERGLIKLRDRCGSIHQRQDYEAVPIAQVCATTILQPEKQPASSLFANNVFGTDLLGKKHIQKGPRKTISSTTSQHGVLTHWMVPSITLTSFPCSAYLSDSF